MKKQSKEGVIGSEREHDAFRCDKCGRALGWLEPGLCNKCRVSASPWIATAERAPTEKDATNGEVLVETEGDYFDLMKWEEVANSPIYYRKWMPIPPLPQEEEKEVL